MKIAFGSDLHLEFGGRDFDLPDADVLLLAGDICVIKHLTVEYMFDRQGQETAQFFMDVSAKYKRVIWIPGNHEFYGGAIGDQSTKIVMEFFAKYFITNIEYTPCGTFELGDLTIVAATLWTDFRCGNQLVMNIIQYGLSDYEEIMIDGDRYITPYDIYDIHKSHLQYIEEMISNKDKVIVMTHHAPNLLSTAGLYIPSDLDYAFCCTDVDDMILDNPQIKYWIHGHTHHNSDYMIGDTNVLSNCRGYVGYEAGVKYFKIQTFVL